ncbi:MAG TPA: glycosyltransferase family 1 protein [Acidimicrobiales bacterium]|jgi:alpha-1,3-rhamnosyl/mannosyltransferase|nr:glycosyltransferase family 1 protein [Acidimicrobiales bacterium]
MTAQGRLHVGVNLLWLVPNVVGGSEEYTTRLLRALAERDPADDGLEVTLFVIRPFLDAYPELTRSFPTVVCPLSGHSKGLRIAAEASWLLARARLQRVDLLHHAGGTIPLLRASPSVVSIHDLQPLLMPSNFSGLKQAYLRRRLPPSARHSRLIVSPSDYSRRTIVGILDVEPDRTRVVSPGYTARLAEPPVGDPRVRYRLDRPFFLYPAITYPHKNHMTLVRAFADVTAKGADTLLVLTHRADTMESQVLALADALGVRDRVRRLGHVPRGDLDWLYANAVALTFPSRFEGFGLPVLEAMGNGCPVIAANATALPEVVFDAGVLVDPDDVAGWAAAMFEMASDEDRRSMLVEAGRARVDEFQWTASAEALVEAYRLAAARSSR